MKLNFALVAAFGSGVLAFPPPPSLPEGVYCPPLPTDLRSPCPMVNTLANHGFLPRNGVNVSLADLQYAFNASLNLEPSATQLVGAPALLTSTTGNASTFNLDNLDTHDILEHDGSLSRGDIYFGDDHTFNTTIWDATASKFTGPLIDFPTAALAHNFAQANAAAINPTFNLSATLMYFSYIESALYLSAFANGTNDTAVTEWVGYMFTEERLPYAEGFRRPSSPITADAVLGLATELSTL